LQTSLLDFGLARGRFEIPWVTLDNMALSHSFCPNPVEQRQPTHWQLGQALQGWRSVYHLLSADCQRKGESSAGIHTH